jgi:hypothetical protein
MTKTERPTLCTVLGILSIIGAVFGIFGVLALGGLSFLAGSAGGAETSMLLIMLTLFMVVGVALSIGSAIGFFGMKKWLPILVMISLGINVIQYLIQAFGENGSFTSGIIGLAISVAILWYVLANKPLFKN